MNTLSGPDNLRAAEDALHDASQEEPGSDLERYFTGVAQVRATMALALATGAALMPTQRTARVQEANAWADLLLVED